MEIVKKPDVRVFASNAKTGEILAFPDVLRGWGVTLDQTQSKPPLEWMNDAFNRIDLNNLYLLQQGIPEWDAATRYPVNSIIKHVDKIYLCTAENENNEPSSVSDKWSLYVRNASEKDSGILKLATQLEVDAGTNDTNAITPKKLDEKLKKLPDASLTQKGLVKLASTFSDSEAEAVTPKGLKDTVLGLNQEYQNMNDNRKTGVTYTNNTGKAIFLSIYRTAMIGGGGYLYVNGNRAAYMAQADTNPVTGYVSLIIPAGATYSAEFSFSNWWEMR